MDRGSELIEALNMVAKEKGIDKELIFEAIETSLVTACKKNFGATNNVSVVIDRQTGEVTVYSQKLVVEEVYDDSAEISLEEARSVDIAYELDDYVSFVITPRDFGRIAAQTAKQVVVQKFREAERDMLYNEYIAKERDVVTGIVQRTERRNVIVAMGRMDAVMPPNEQVASELYETHDRIKVYVVEVRQTSKGPMMTVSRTHPELIRRLFEQEIAEVHEGIVEVKSIAREAGSRTKIAVYSNNPDVDPVGACVGINGYRVNIIVSELRGEKIDIINWSEDPRQYIAAALNPSRVLAVVANPEEQTAKVVVPDNQLSLAIGREGQNARLAARLTGWRIDIKSESQSRETGFVSGADYFADASDFGDYNGGW